MGLLDDRLGEGTQERGRWFYRLEDSPIAQDPRTVCNRWYYAQPAYPRYFDWNWPCPCSVRQAWRDRRYRWYFNQFFDEDCFVFNRRHRDIRGVWRRQCCYSREFSIRDGSLTRSGYLLLRPNFPNALGFISDEEAYRACCLQSNLCYLLYEKRPPGQCFWYRPPRIGKEIEVHLHCWTKLSYQYTNKCMPYVLIINQGPKISISSKR